MENRDIRQCTSEQSVFNLRYTPVRFALFAVLLLLLAGCGPRLGAESETVADEEFAVSLPALVIDVDENGAYSVGGIALADMGALLGQDLALPALDAGMLEMVAKGNIQHVQVVNQEDGLTILVNGEPIPSLNWDGESLLSTAEMLGQLGVDVPLLDKLLPLAQNMGLGVTVNFPVAAGEAALPLLAAADASMAAASADAQDAWLDSVGDVGAQLRLQVGFDAEGNAMIGGIEPAELEALGVQLDALKQSEENLAAMDKLGIDKLDISSDADGLVVTINDKPLPQINWGSGEISHLVNLAVKMGLLDSIGSGDVDAETMLEIINLWLPALQASHIDVTVEFP